MSEQKPKTKSQQLEEIIQSQGKTIEEMQKQLTTLTTPKPEPKPAEPVHEHKKEPVAIEPPRPTTDALQHYIDCPECHKKINEVAKKELEPKFLQAQREKVKSLKTPVICKDCGEIVEGTTPECPNCHGKEPRKFSY